MSIFTRLVDDKRPKVIEDEDKILYKKLKDSLINGGFLTDVFEALDRDYDAASYEYIMTHRIYLNTFYDDRFKLYRLKEIENDYTIKLEKMLNKLLKGFGNTVTYNFKLVQEDVGIKDPYLIYLTVNITELKELVEEARKNKNEVKEDVDEED